MEIQRCRHSFFFQFWMGTLSLNNERVLLFLFCFSPPLHTLVIMGGGNKIFTFLLLELEQIPDGFELVITFPWFDTELEAVTLCTKK